MGVYLELVEKALTSCNWRSFGVFIANFESISTVSVIDFEHVFAKVFV